MDMEAATPNVNTSVFNDAPVRKMNEIMRRKLSLLRDMLNLSEQANNYLGEENVDLLNNIIDAKQELIRDIDHLDKKFLIEFETLKTEQGISSMEELKMSLSTELPILRENTSAILDILNKIYAFEKKFNGGAVKLRDDIAAELNRIRRQKQINAFYSNDSPRRKKNEPANHPAFSSFDKKK